MKKLLLIPFFLTTVHVNGVRAEDVVNKDQPKSADEKFEDLRKALPFDLHGGAYLWYYQPFLDGGKADASLYYAWLSFSAKFDDFGFYFEPRFRDSKLRPFFNSNNWVQEAYASWKVPADLGTLKVGKEYSRLGRFWDGCFYGNLSYFDGLKLDPDVGLSLENTVKTGDNLSTEYSVQYFVNDGGTNGSLADDALSKPRDTIGDGGARQRHSFVGRIAPTLKISDDLSVTLGLSGQSFEADFQTAESDRVNRGDVEAAVKYRSFEIFAESCWQSGHHVLNYPVTGSPSDHNRYIMTGAIYTWDAFSFRYNYSAVNYDNEVSEQFHMPAVVWAAKKNLSLWLEYVDWRQKTASTNSVKDRSLNFVVDVHF